ncbi:MAG: protein lap4 isoform [Bacteroidota bacterium]|jgi:Leucine-rich repeat (LRR) protein|nr:protein lap4 isoform [Bacteroidota bacterium]
MIRFCILFIFAFYLTDAQPNEFDKYGPFGSRIYTDLKQALEIETGVYKMDLSYKKLEPKLYSKIGKLKDLQALRLSGNEVNSYPPGFEGLHNLVYFSSYNNEFAEFPDLKKLGNLNYLEFFGSKIDSIPANIAYLNKLKTFKISSTNDTLKLPNTFKYLKNLKDVTIENCVLDSFPKEIFKIPNVNYLNLTNTNIFYLTKHFERFINLEVLVLDANHLRTLPFEIYKAKKLRLLSVKNNQLQKLPDTICQLENLTLLDVRGNNFSKEYLEELKALLPGCEIRY